MYFLAVILPESFLVVLTFSTKKMAQGSSCNFCSITIVCVCMCVINTSFL